MEAGANPPVDEYPILKLLPKQFAFWKRRAIRAGDAMDATWARARQIIEERRARGDVRDCIALTRDRVFVTIDRQRGAAGIEDDVERGLVRPHVDHTRVITVHINVRDRNLHRRHISPFAQRLNARRLEDDRCVQPQTL